MARLYSQNIMRLTFLLVLAVLSVTPMQAQTPEDDVKAVVQRLFDGMRAADSTAVRAVFHEQGRLFVLSEREGETVLRESSVSDFAGRLGRGERGALDERAWDVEVRIDGPLATAWMPYGFWLKGEFSHCGIDAFQLTRDAEGWKILQLAYTARKEGCEVPEGVGRP